MVPLCVYCLITPFPWCHWRPLELFWQSRTLWLRVTAHLRLFHFKSGQPLNGSALKLNTLVTICDWGPAGGIHKLSVGLRLWNPHVFHEQLRSCFSHNSGSADDGKLWHSAHKFRLICHVLGICKIVAAKQNKRWCLCCLFNSILYFGVPSHVWAKNSFRSCTAYHS